jgi:hypothetical protein
VKLRVERTVSYQVEGPGESYCATTYSRHDAELVKRLAETIPNLHCLKEGSKGKQPKGLYVYVRGQPLVETYDRRLDKLVRQHISEIKGDF